jgi:hypothetical protein
MMVKMFPRLLTICSTVLLVIGLAPLAAMADDKVVYDGRLEGYGSNVTLDGGSATLWFLLVLLAAIALGVLFKHAKRTHLD